MKLYIGHKCGKVDGIVGGKTKALIKSFQNSKGLQVDGLAGPKTRLGVLYVYNKDFTRREEMSNYWARFEKVENDVFRYDTRVYLNPINSPGEDDICIGAIVGKNPGSAIATCLAKADLQKINLDGDNLLPNIKSIFLKSYRKSNIPIDKDVYIQVLNLMYICDQNLIQAIKKIENHNNPTICLSEEKDFPFVWYVWGNSDTKLNQYKTRFNTLNTNMHFFLNTKTKEVVNGIPTENEPARHPQGMPHKLVTSYISDILKSMVVPT